MRGECHIMRNSQLHQNSGELPSVSGRQGKEIHVVGRDNARRCKHMLQERCFLVVGDSGDGQRVSQNSEGRHRRRNRGGSLRRDRHVGPIAPVTSHDMTRPREFQTCRMQGRHSKGYVAIVRRQQRDHVAAREGARPVEYSSQLTDNEVSCALVIGHRGKSGRVENGALPRPRSQRSMRGGCQRQSGARPRRMWHWGRRHRQGTIEMRNGTLHGTIQ